jgi:hypothetical protein
MLKGIYCLFWVGCLAAEPQIFHGHTTLSNQTLEEITVHGPTNISNLKVTKLATLKGPVSAVDSTIANLYIQGIAKLDHVDVKELFSTGMLFVLNSVVEELSAQAEELNLTNTQVAKVTLRKHAKPTTVYLEKGTRVEKIRFIGEDGKVVIGDASASVESVEGGVVISFNDTRQ